MDKMDQARETQLSNIETKTGRSRQDLYAEILGQGLPKHGEMVAWAKAELGLGHGDANTLVHMARQSAATTQEAGDPLDAIFAGAKADLRPIHDALMAEISAFGAFDIAPKKTYLSLRRKKQFAMLGPKTKTRYELGLNLKEDAVHPLMKAERPGGMCQYTVSLHSVDDIDREIIDLVRKAYDSAS